MRFFGYLTVKDVLRLGIPVALTGFFTYKPVNPVGTLLGITAGLLIGVAWVTIQVEGDPIDVHLYNAVRQHIETRFGDSTGLHTVEDGYAVTDRGTAVAAVKVQPVPLSMQSESNQQALHSVLEDLYETVSFPVEVHSRQLPLSLDSYINTLEDRPETESLASYTEYCQELNEGDATTTHHYIIVKTQKDRLSGFEELAAQLRDQYTQIEQFLDRVEPYLPFDPAKISKEPQPRLSELEHRINIVVDAVNRSTLEAERLTGIEFQQYIRSFNHDVETARDSHQVSEAQVGEYRKMVYVDEFPASARLGWIVDLLNQNSAGRVDIVQRVEPRNQSKAVRSLERRIERLQAEINSRIGGGLIKDVAELEARQEDARDMVDLCADNTQSLVNYSVYLVAHGSTPEERDAAYSEVTTRLDTMLADYKRPLFRSDQAVKTESALHGNRLNESLLMPSSSAAAGFPFATTNRNEGRGVIYGTSTEDGSPVLLDLWSWSSHSSAILGKTGSGKSFFAKMLLLRWKLAYPRLDQLIVVDPKNECSPIINQLGGSLHTIEAGEDYTFDRDVVGFQVPERGRKENVDQLIDLIRSIYTATSQDKNRAIVVIDEAHNILRRKEGREALEQFVREARDTKTAIVMISQNADDFASNLEGKNILKNLAATFLMRHADVAEDVVDFFDLSNRERTELQKLKTGTEASYSEALMKISDRLDSKVRIDATDTEHTIIEKTRGD